MCNPLKIKSIIIIIIIIIIILGTDHIQTIQAMKQLSICLHTSVSSYVDPFLRITFTVSKEPNFKLYTLISENKNELFFEEQNEHFETLENFMGNMVSQLSGSIHVTG